MMAADAAGGRGLRNAMIRAISNALLPSS